jgi:hypothetical protein
LRPYLLAAFVLALPPIQPARVTLDLPAYLVELDRVKTAIDRTATADEGRAIVESLPDRWWVTADGQVVVVEMRWIDVDVESSGRNEPPWTAARERIRRRLMTMREIAAARGDLAAIAPGKALDAILARPEFQRSARSRWLEEQRARLGNWLAQLFDRLTGSGLGGRALAITLAWILSIVALVLLVAWFVTMLTRRSRATALDLAASAPPRAPARDWAMRALAAARAGDLREAVRCAYHAALSKLDEQGVWTVDDARTPREYLRLLRADDPRHPAVRDLTRQFEQVWYGHRTPTTDDAQTLSAHLEHLGCVHASERAI